MRNHIEANALQDVWNIFQEKQFPTCRVTEIQLALPYLWNEVQDIRKHMQKSTETE